MNKEFIPYELALELKELSFDEKCFKYNLKGVGIIGNIKESDYLITPVKNSDLGETSYTLPLWQQAFDFLWNKTGKYIIPIPNEDKEWLCRGNKYKTYEEARLECLKKLIEIVKNDK